MLCLTCSHALPLSGQVCSPVKSQLYLLANTAEVHVKIAMLTVHNIGHFADVLLPDCRSLLDCTMLTVHNIGHFADVLLADCRSLLDCTWRLIKDSSCRRKMLTFAHKTWLGALDLFDSDINLCLSHSLHVSVRLSLLAGPECTAFRGNVYHSAYSESQYITVFDSHKSVDAFAGLHVYNSCGMNGYDLAVIDFKRSS